MSIVNQIDLDIPAAMKAKEGGRLSALRMIKTALKLRETELPGPIDDTEAIRVLQKLLNQRRDAAEQFRAAGREDRAVREEDEAKIIELYLPAAATQEELAAIVDAAIAESGAKSSKEMGAVMKIARARLEGKLVDGRALSELVKSKLSS